MKKRILALSVLLAFCLIVPALALSRYLDIRVNYEKTYSGDTPPNISQGNICKAETKALNSSKDEVQNIYARAWITNADTGRVISPKAETTEHYTLTTSAESTFWYPMYNADEMTIGLYGLGRIRYTDSLVLEDDTARETNINPMNYGRSSQNAIRKSTFGIGQEKQDYICNQAAELFGKDFTELNYMPTANLFNDEFDESLSNLKALMNDMCAELDEGDFMPFGVFYNDERTTAYTIQEKSDGSFEYKEYDIAPNESARVASESFAGTYIVTDIIMVEK